VDDVALVMSDIVVPFTSLAGQVLEADGTPSGSAKVLFSTDNAS
jgi:hypothetical protein